MQQTTQQVIEKLINELAELKDRIRAMETFFVCQDYTEISERQQALLCRQHSVMCEYKEILITRIQNLRKEAQHGTQSN